MKPLPLVDGCGLTPSGLDEQSARVGALRPAVTGVDQEPGAVRVSFGAGVDEALVRRLVDVERGCCSFLGLEWDSSARVLSITSDEREDVLTLFGESFR